MSEYNEFSRVYDLFMEDIPYEAWCERIVSILKDRGICDGLVCELGCGTGNMTELLAEAGQQGHPLSLPGHPRVRTVRHHAGFCSGM